MPSDIEAGYLAAIIHSSDDAIIAKDLNGTITSWNPAATRIFGYAAEEAVGRSITILLPPDRLGEEEVIIGRIRRGERVEHFETMRRAKDGREIPISLTISPIRAADGTIIGASKIARDISDRKHAERALGEAHRRSEEWLALLDALQSTAPIGIGFMDRASRYIRVNEALAAISGVAAQDHIGREVRDVTPTVWPKLEPGYRGVVEEGKSFLNVEMRGIAAAPGDARDWLVSLYPVRMRDEIIGVGIIVMEITDRKRMEMQLVQAQKMEAIGTLTGGLAHDFNNLLGVIMGNLDLLRESSTVTPDAAELLDEALATAERGAELTRSLLSFARRQPLQPQRVEPNALVVQLVKLLNRTLGEAIQTSLDLGVEVWPVVADPVQLETSLTNLATNARDAMPDGGTLMISTRNRCLDEDYALLHPEVTPGDYVMIEVSDSGLGIAPEVLSRIFEPFFTTKAEGKGTGLGLSMVFGFIKQSGGHINVYSELGAGTTFRLYLPRADAGKVAADDAVSRTPPRGGVERVLVVEDNAAMRRVVVRQLTQLGYEVLEAESPATALATIEQHEIDLLFSDIVMPGPIDGIKLAAQVRARRPGVKILLTSGFPDMRFKGNAATMPAGARLLTKPYRREELARAVRAVLGF